MNSLSSQTGLGPMANTVVGGHIGPGLSGGQVMTYLRNICAT